MDHTVLQAHSFLRTHLARAFIAALVLMSPAVAGLSTASAQVIIATVNNDPITNIDLEQRIKMQRILRKPATSEAALDSLVDDRVKSGEVKKYNVKPTDSEVNREIARVAGELKIDPNTMVSELEHAGVSADHYRAHFTVDYAFNNLVKALNKG